VWSSRCKSRRLRGGSAAFGVAVGLAIADAEAARAPGSAPFEIQAVASDGRNVGAALVDVDGDGRADLLALVIRGMPPNEQRELHVRFSDQQGRVAEAPDWRAPIPAGAGAYDFGDLDGEPGDELLFLRADRVTVLKLAEREPRWQDLRTPIATATPAPDERGLDRLRLLRPKLGAAPLLVPGLGDAVVLGRQGEVFGLLHVGARANYFLPPRPGPLIGENEMELYFDVPRLEVADVDGDGRPDIVTAGRHELRIFLQQPGGRFAREPDRIHALGLLSPEDHVRNAGGVRVDVRDHDGDGRADLLISHASGGVLRAVTRTRLYRNRDGEFALDGPDQEFERSGGIVLDELVDLDGDGRPDLLRMFLPLGLLDLARLFVQRSLEFETEVRTLDAEGRFEEEPWTKRSFKVAIDFETLRPKGFIPNLRTDWNGDGFVDLISAGHGSAVEIWLGGPRHRFRTRQAQQELDTGGRLRVGDLDGDGLPDFVLHDPRRPDAPMRVGRNLGALPDTKPGIRSSD
jgi:hypothetical protein